MIYFQLFTTFRYKSLKNSEIETAREKAFLRTEYSGMHLWCRKRTSGVPNEPRGGGNVPDYHLTLEAMKRLVFISNWT